MIAAIAATTIFGLIARVPVLVTFIPTGSPVVMNAAVSLLVLGCGFFALTIHRLAIARICGGAAFLIGTFALVEAISGRSFGIDQFLFHPWLVTPETSPGRMAPNTGLALALIGTAVVQMAARRRSLWVLSILGGAALAFALVPLLSLLAAVYRGGPGAPYRDTALPTMLGLFVSSAAVLRGARGNPGGERTTLPIFAAAIALLTSVSAVAVGSTARLVEANHWVAHSLDVKASIETFIADGARLETAARAYALTGQDKFLVQIKAHRSDTEADLAALATLVADNPRQVARMRVIRQFMQLKYSFTDRLVHERQTGGLTSAAAAMAHAPPVMIGGLGLGVYTRNLAAEESDLLTEREAEMAALERNVRVIQVGGTTIALILVLLALAMTRRAARARDRAEQALRQSHATLETRVAERTISLEKLNSELRELESRFRGALQDSPGPVLLWAEDGRVLLHNRAWLELSGYAAHEIPTVSAWMEKARRMPPADLESYLPRQFSESTRVHDGEAPVHTKGQTTLVWDFYTALIGQYADGRRLLVTQAVDVTARKKAEVELLESERRFRFLADVLPQIIWTAKPDGNLDYYNQRWYDYTGLTFEQTKDWGWRPVIHPDDLAHCVQHWTEAFTTGTDYEVEYRFQRAHDGTYRWHLGRAFPLRDAAGKIIRWVGTCTDIHDQKLATERLETLITERTSALRLSEERFRNAFEFAGIGMAIVGTDGRWIRVNERVCQIVGYSEMELRQKTFQDITHPDDLDMDLKFVNELIAGTRRFYTLEKRYLHRAGHTVWIRLTASLVRDEFGAPVHFVSQIEDIEERRQLEVNLARARDEALDASRLKSEFLANMSHEIRTPMNAVIGMAGLLLDSPLTAAQHKMGDLLLHSAEGLLTIINDILDFSRIEAGKLRIQLSSFDLRLLAEETVSLLTPTAQAKLLTLSCAIDPAVPPRLLGDAGRIRQVLTNLVGNAVKFTDRGKVAVTIRAVRTSGERAALRIEVADTGIGVPVASQSRLFQPFIQATAEVQERFGGTGLGLAISRQLIELMGGTIGFHSEEGIGSTFWFEFDLAIPAAEPLRAAADFRDKPRALIANCSSANGQILQEQLCSLGLDANQEHSAIAGLNRLRAAAESGRPYRIAFLGQAGSATAATELAATIRADPALANLSLICLSPVEARADPSAADAIHFDGILGEPVRQAQLERTLARLLPIANGGGREKEAGRLRPQLRLLVAEDHPANQMVARMLLAKMGFAVQIAGDGVETLERLAHESFDAVLMDCRMPRLDGYETTRRIRSGTLAGVNAHIPIVALTAYAMPEDRRLCLAAGMNDYVTKPIHEDDLREALRRCGLGGGSFARSGPAAALPQAGEPQPGPPADGVVDWAQLQQLDGLTGENGGALVPQLIALFLAELPERIARLSELVHARSGAELGELAHKIAGSCANLGGRQMRKSAQDLESSAQVGDWEQANHQLRTLRDDYVKLAAALAIPPKNTA